MADPLSRTLTGQPKGARKIVTASSRDNQHRQPERHQLPEVAVDGAIAAEEQNDVRLSRNRGDPNAPVDARVGLKWLEIFRRTSQPEDGGRAHVRA